MTVDQDAVVKQALKLSSALTEQIGARAIDLLHVASALALQSEQFLTTDARQAQLAKTEGMKVVMAV